MWASRPSATSAQRIVPQLSTSRLRRQNIHNGIPEALEREEKPGDVVEREIKSVRVCERINTVNAGWDLVEQISLNVYKSYLIENESIPR